MSAFLYRLGRNSARHPFRVLGVWLVAAIAIVALQGSAGGKFDNSERVPGVESQHAADVLNDRFPSQGGQSARIVLHTDEGRLDDAGHAPTVEQARAQLAAGHDVAGVTDPFAPQSAAVSADGQTAYVDVTYAVDKLTTTQLDDAMAVTRRSPRRRRARSSSPVSSPSLAQEDAEQRADRRRQSRSSCCCSRSARWSRWGSRSSRR